MSHEPVERISVMPADRQPTFRRYRPEETHYGVQDTPQQPVNEQALVQFDPTTGRVIADPSIAAALRQVRAERAGQQAPVEETVQTFMSPDGTVTIRHTHAETTTTSNEWQFTGTRDLAVMGSVVDRTFTLPISPRPDRSQIGAGSTVEKNGHKGSSKEANNSRNLSKKQIAAIGGLTVIALTVSGFFGYKHGYHPSLETYTEATVSDYVFGVRHPISQGIAGDSQSGTTETQTDNQTTTDSVQNQPIPGQVQKIVGGNQHGR